MSFGTPAAPGGFGRTHPRRRSPILYYISRKLAGREKAREVVRDCLSVLGIISVARDHLEAAYALESGDFEDDLRIVCAMVVTLDAIVTRNPADFSLSPIPVWTPPQLIAHLTAEAMDENG